jgi:hypothetical protein
LSRDALPKVNGSSTNPERERKVYGWVGEG